MRLPEHGCDAEFEPWSLALDGLFDTACPPDTVASFTGSIQARITRHVMLTSISAAQVRLVRSPAAIARSGLRHFSVWLIDKGRMSGSVARRHFCAEAGDVFCLDLQQTAELQLVPTGQPATSLAMWFPLPSLPNDKQGLHGLTFTGTTPAGALIGANVRALATSAERLSINDLDVLADSVVTLITRLLAPAAPATGASNSSERPDPLVLMTRFIDRHLGSNDLDAGMLAQQFGLSRASLYRLFAPVGGVAEFIRRRRLDRAYEEIVAADSSTRRISQIGFDLGFRNMSNFSRTFRQEFGVSPRAARHAALAGARPIQRPLRAIAGASLAHLLSQVDNR